jgi:hypothetical protein
MLGVVPMNIGCRFAEQVADRTLRTSPQRYSQGVLQSCTGQPILPRVGANVRCEVSGLA